MKMVKEQTQRHHTGAYTGTSGYVYTANKVFMKINMIL